MEDEEDNQSEQEAKDMAIAMAASMESGHPGASTSELCEICGVEPHQVQDCPLVKRLTSEEASQDREEGEEGQWQQVKAASAKPAKQPEGHKGKGKIENKRKGKGKLVGQHGSKGQSAAGRVLSVRRGNPTGR